MTVERKLRLIAGAFVAASVLLGMFVHAGFLWFTLFVGLNLLQSGVTDWCPMMTLLRRLQPGAATGGSAGIPSSSAAHR